MIITLFKNAKSPTNGEDLSVEEFNNSVKLGKYKELIEPIRQESDKKKRQEMKKYIPLVTISGTFANRSINGLKEHSGLICIDVDDYDPNEIFETLKEDQFIYSMFRSASGNGVAIVVKIDGKRHVDSFIGLESYFANKYQIFVDKACKDVSRARFVSYDPKLFVNQDSKVFRKYVPKAKQIQKKKIPVVVTGNNDMDFLINQIEKSRVDLTDSDYVRFRDIGFALSEEFGENGRRYFHSICSQSDKYSTKICDDQFNKCLKHSGNGITIATLLYYAKQAGLSIVSPETKQITTVAVMTKKSGRGLHNAIQVLSEVDGIPEKVSKPIVEKIFNREDIGSENMLSKLDQIERFIDMEYDLKRNEITRFIENSGKEIDTVFMNSIWRKATKVVDEKISYEHIDRLIQSDFIESYNPLKDFFENNSHEEPEGLIRELAKCITSDSGMKPGNVVLDYKHDFIKKWLVGIIASIHGEHSPLLLALTGGQNTGKTQFFRRLLPKELSGYYAESKLDSGTDDELLMTQKLLICDDEFGGKSKLEAKKLKELTSKEYFTLREPYGRKNVTLKRLAVLCGTSNDDLLLNDPTGNRRIIPINVESIDHEAYNSIDKKLLFIEAYHEWKNGYDWNLTREDVDNLSKNTIQFEQIRPEKELIMRYFKESTLAEPLESVVGMQATEIKAHIERASGQRLSIAKIGQELKALGFEQVNRRINGHPRKVYQVVKIDNENSDSSKLDGISGNNLPWD